MWEFSTWQLNECWWIIVLSQVNLEKKQVSSKFTSLIFFWEPQSHLFFCCWALESCPGTNRVRLVVILFVEACWIDSSKDRLVNSINSIISSVNLEWLEDEGKVSLKSFVFTFSNLITNWSIQALSSVCLHQGLEHWKTCVSICLSLD